MSTTTPRTTTKGGDLTPNSQYGIHLHGYILGKSLGSGAYAKVKAATRLKDPGRGKECAIKIIDKTTAPPDVITKFIPREIDVLKSLDHKYIIKLLDVIDTPRTMYLIMELAESGDLLDFINVKRYLSERIARTLFKDLVEGMEHCHSKNIVHRDLKCENLLLDSKYRLKISDFGFARRTQGNNLETYCGSYAYAAPEVILGTPYIGEAADIWSMGIVLYAMMAGKLPFKDSDVRTLLNEITTTLVFPNRLTTEAKDLVRHMLVFNPKERLTIDEIKEHPWYKMDGEASRRARDNCTKSSLGPPHTDDRLSNKPKAGGSSNHDTRRLPTAKIAADSKTTVSPVPPVKKTGKTSAPQPSRADPATATKPGSLEVPTTNKAGTIATNKSGGETSASRPGTSSGTVPTRIHP